MLIFGSTAGPLRKMSAEVPERINPSWSVHDGVGHPHSVINTKPKTVVDLLAVLDGDMEASCFSLPFKNEVFFLGFKNIQCRNLGKWKSTTKNLTN